MDNNIMSLNDDEYMSGNEWDRAMDENKHNPVEEATESLMSSAEMTKGTHKRRHSKCWKNFTIIGERLPDGKNDIRCNHCKVHYLLDVRRNGTTTLLRHMRICSKTSGSTPGSSTRKIDMMVFRELIVVAIVEHDLPYSFVEYRRIREAFAYANSSIAFWSRNTAAADVLKIFEKEKTKLRQILSEVPGRICLTTDLWRAITVEGYLCMTSHYIDANWNLQANILSFCAFPPPHSGVALAMKLMELLKAWGLDKKVFTITVDNAHETSDDETICDMVDTMKLKFQKYWEDYSDILAIAAVLDPRLKFAFLEYCFSTLDQSTSKSRLDHIRKKMEKLYGVYKKNPKNTAATSQVMEDNLPSGYGGFYAFFSQNAGIGKSALDMYLDELVLDMVAFQSLDILKYWKDNATRFNELSRMACDVLCIPITTVSSESSFSVGSRVLNKYRSRLLPSNVQALICARNWLRGFEEISESEFFEEDKEEEKEDE